MNENDQALVERPPLTAVEIRGQVNLIQEVMREVMTDGQHYGKIPGCGEKPTLLKPGAEKLSVTFRLRPIIDNDRDINVETLEGGHQNIRVYCHVFNSAGLELATGVGSCSTMESKFRYRGGLKVSTGQPVPKEYWNLKKEGKMKESQEMIGGPGFGVMKGDTGWEICELGAKAENPDIADTYNTVLKMAKKRAYVDGILSATGASDIFTQDIEDLPEGAIQGNGNGHGKSAKTHPDPKSEPAAKTGPSPEINVLENVFVAQVYEQKTKNGKDMFTIEIDKKRYSTFSATHKKIAVEARDHGVKVSVQYKVNGDFLNLSDIKLTGEMEPDGQE